MLKLNFAHKLILVLAIAFVGMIFTTTDSYAFNPCTRLSSAQKNNSSIKNACDNLERDTSISEHAAAWLINKDATGNNIYSSTIAVDQSTGTVEISIVSAVVRKYLTSELNPCKYNGRYCNRYAREVKVLDSSPSRRSPGEGNNLKTVPYLKDVPNTLYAGNFPARSYITSSFTRKNLKLDIDKFKSSVPANSCGNNDPNCYQTKVYVYRCYSLVEKGTLPNYQYYGSSIYGGAPNNSCSAVPSTIRVIIPGAPKPPEDSSNSDTSFNNEAQKTCMNSADAGPYYGNTTSKSSVSNTTTNKSASVPSSGMNASEGSNYVFARPGDKISFSHSLCFGAQGLKNGSDKANYFTISSNKSLGDSASTSVVTNNKITLTQSTPTPIQLNNKVDELKNFGFSVNSPRGSNKYTVSNDAPGSTIMQTFTHNILDGYVNRRSRKVGSCGCGDNSARIEYENFSSYDSARSSSNSFPTWGQIDNFGCFKGGNCSCTCTNGTPPDNCATWSCGEQYKYNTNQSVSFPKTYDNESKDITKTTKVYIPYNFTTSVDSDRQKVSSGGTIYAGEVASSRLRLEVAAKANQPVTNSSSTTYVTQLPPSAKYRVISFTTTSSSNLGGNRNATIPGDDLCSYFGKTLNSDCKLVSSGDGSGITTKDITVTDVVPDSSVETKYCVAIGIYPADSHNWDAPTNDNNINVALSGGNTWNISGASCRTIAKKPNFQVWNNGLYTSGNISTSISKKRLSATLLTPTVSDTKVFGSWDEQVAIAKGEITGFASGATLGYGGYGYTKPGGGANTNDFRSLSPLTISNSTNSSGHSNINSDATALIARILARFAPEDIPNEITITNNITLPDQDSLSVDELAQNIIIAKNKINIADNVTRVDAWLVVTDGEVDTCTDGQGNPITLSASTCNRQLTINGPILAKKLSLHRTAGAGPGDGSIDPAEIFNLRPDAYLWGFSQARSFSETYVVYSRELAPRY